MSGSLPQLHSVQGHGTCALRPRQSAATWDWWRRPTIPDVVALKGGSKRPRRDCCAATHSSHRWRVCGTKVYNESQE